MGAKRDPIDLSHIKPEHAEIHDRLANWARWCRDGGHATAVHPMFRDCRDGYATSEATTPIDTLDALRIQRAYVRIPELHRWALCWWYCRPWIPVMRVRQALGLTMPGLAQCIGDGRAMVKNTVGAT